MPDAYDQDTGEIIEPRRALPAVASSTPDNLIFASQECDQVFGALSEAQGKMTNPRKTKEATVRGTTKSGASYDYKYKYAPLEEVVDTIRAPMSEAGMIYRQFLASRQGAWVMRTIIAHKSGQWFGCDYPIYFDQSKGAQGFASGVTYARRYGLMLALGIVAEDDDDANVADGNIAKIDGEGRQSAGSTGGHRIAPQHQQAAQQPAGTPGDIAANRKAAASTAYNDLWKAIAACEEIDKLAVLASGAQWGAMVSLINAAESKERAETLIQRMSDHALARQGILSGPPLEEYEA
jgi:hypothetical protein